MRKTAQIPVLGMLQTGGMKRRDLTPKQLNSIPCPTCGVSAGQRCLLAAGGMRVAPHVDRQLAAAEDIEARKLSA